MNERLASHRRAFSLVELVVVIGVILLLTALTVTVLVGIQRRSDIRATENTMRLLETALSEWELATGRSITFGQAGEPCDVGESYDVDQLVGANPPSAWNTDAFTAQRDALIATDRLWAIVSASTSPREMIARVDPIHVIQLDPSNTADMPVHFGLDTLDHLNGRSSVRFLDAWDNPILAIMPGRRSNAQCNDNAYCVGGLTPALPTTDNHCPDLDGTIRTPYENRFGVAVNRQIYFVSAGPSSAFGNLRLDTAHGSLTAEQHDDANAAADNIYSYDVLVEEARP